MVSNIWQGWDCWSSWVSYCCKPIEYEQNNTICFWQAVITDRSGNHASNVAHMCPQYDTDLLLLNYASEWKRRQMIAFPKLPEYTVSMPLTVFLFRVCQVELWNITICRAIILLERTQWMYSFKDCWYIEYDWLVFNWLKMCAILYLFLLFLWWCFYTYLSSTVK
jgi:hypothetical protein